MKRRNAFRLAIGGVLLGLLALFGRAVGVDHYRDEVRRKDRERRP